MIRFISRGKGWVLAVLLMGIALGLPHALYGQKKTNFTLDNVRFSQVDASVTYTIELYGEVRTLTFKYLKHNNIDILVADAKGAELLTMNVSEKGYTGVMGGQKVGGALSDKFVFPKKTDARAKWLLGQNILANTCLAPEVVVPLLTEEESGVTEQFLPYDILSRNLQAFLDWLTGDAASCDGGGETQCIEIDVSGLAHTVVFSCDCGQPVCTEQGFSTTVVYAEIDNNGEVRTHEEIAAYTKCVCHCALQMEGEYN